MQKDFYWLNEESKVFLQRGYLLEGVDAKTRIEQIAEYAANKLKDKKFKDKFMKYMSRGYFSLSSPIWANFGLERGLPISCFGSYVGDSIEQIFDTASEVAVMSKIGGGTSVYLGGVRPRGSAIKDNGKTDGTFNFLKVFDTTINVVSQGTARKGQCAAYIDIDHGDIEEWLDIHTEGNDIQTMYYGVCVSKKWLEEMKTESNNGNKRKIWAKLLKRRSETGIPYLFFKDNANNNTVDVYKDKNLTIHNSNLCNEIYLPNNTLESFVCCLSSLNLLHYEEWKDTDAVETLVRFLDVVITDFVEKSADRKHLEKAHRFAKRHRALGLGVLGWHSYLQSNMIAFEDKKAFDKTKEIFSLIKERAYKASEDLAKEFGEPEILKGYGRRNTTLLAIAPTKSSSFILGGVSPSIEPVKSNFYIRDLAKIKSVYKNPYLEKLLEEKGKNTDDVWEMIKIYDGSVQGLSFLTEEEKKVFKTFAEIDPNVIVEQAALRQKYVDQGQSINLTIPSNWSLSQRNALTLKAEELGLKGLYYQNAVNAAQDFSRSLYQRQHQEKQQAREMETCSSCEA